MRINDYNCKFFSNSATLNAFLNEVRKYDIPTIQEEEKLIESYKNGDIEAGKTLVCKNLRFIYSLAKIYARNETEVVDYVNEGVEGFMMALKDFDLNRGYKFITYAVWYIRRSMNYYLTDTRNMITRTNAAKIGKKIDVIKQKTYAENGREATTEEIKDILKKEYNIDIKENCDILDINMTSISEEVDDDYTIEDSSEFSEKTAVYNEYEDACEKDYKRAMVNAIMGVLPEKQGDMIKMLYGIDYDRQYSTQEVGDKYGIRAVEVAKIHEKAIKYIQQNADRIKHIAL